METKYIGTQGFEEPSDRQKRRFQKAEKEGKGLPSIRKVKQMFHKEVEDD